MTLAYGKLGGWIPNCSSLLSYTNEDMSSVLSDSTSFQRDCPSVQLPWRWSGNTVCEFKYEVSWRNKARQRWCGIFVLFQRQGFHGKSQAGHLHGHTAREGHRTFLFFKWILFLPTSMATGEIDTPKTFEGWYHKVMCNVTNVAEIEAVPFSDDESKVSA